MWSFQFGKTFPFEGNWNYRHLDSWPRSVFMFGKTFPFEGNWNLHWQTIPIFQTFRSERPSRLKGIETRFCRRAGELSPPVRKDLPVWRELKPRYWRNRKNRTTYKFGKTFPFEGNWNSRSTLSKTGWSPTRSERPSRLKGIETQK